MYPNTLHTLEAVTAVPECVVLAVKPQMMESLLPPLFAKFGAKPLYISIAAGKTLGFFERFLPGSAIVRAMPNTPSLVGKGMSGLYANAATTHYQKTLAENLLKAAGEVIWLEKESLMDVVTAISGSGPAYLFLFMESLVKAAIENGITPEQAKILVLQMVTGAAELAMQSGESLAELRQNVTSKGGTTEAALGVLMHNDVLESLLKQAVDAAVHRAIALS